MKIATAWSTDATPAVITRLYDSICAKLGATPGMLMVHGSVGCDFEAAVNLLRERAPAIPTHGSTSCLGVMTEAGFHSEEGRGLGLFGLYDPDGGYGVGAAVIGDDPRAAARRAVNEAVAGAGRPGEVPAMVWMSAAPGHEEALIAGIAEVVGDDVPVTGGSAADNTVSGHWKQCADGVVHTNAVVIAVLFPSTEVMFAFHSGYEPAQEHGTITKARGRELIEIDGHPAAVVYNEWTGGLIADTLRGGGNILARTTLHPLGRVAGHIGGMPYYQLSHPDAVTASGSLTLFSDVAPGEQLVHMRGTVDSLVTRAGRVAAAALETHALRPADVAGALVVYCAGCMLTVRERINEVVDSLRAALPDTPFLGVFTFGEQGCFAGGENRHGNLMISVLLFGK